MLEKSERERSLEERRLLEAHLEVCSDCAAFKGFRESVRSALGNPPGPELDPRLVERVRGLCHSEMTPKTARRAARVPLSIWAALGLLTVITLGFFIPQIQEFFATKEFTPAMGFLSAILLQNAVMLFFAPIIMRHQRIDQNDWRECR